MRYNISDVVELRTERREFLSKFRLAVNPRLNDTAKLKEIHSFLMEKVSKKYGSVIDRRRTFTLIAAMLYAPKSIVGYNLPYGLRKVVGDCCGVQMTTISKALNQAITYYRFYAAYRAEVDRLYSCLLDWLDSPL